MSKSIAKRHQFILSKLKEQGFVNVNDLSNELNVSVVTIRKDLKVLEDRKLLHRTHGSASLINPYIADRNIHDKEKLNVEQKLQVAKAAAKLIEPNDSIILASGSTILELARQILSVEGLTVVTPSLNVAQVLNLHSEVEVHQLGGVIRKSSNSAVGPQAEKMMQSFSCNKLFLGVDGIDAELGLTTTNALEASLNQLMIKAVQKVIVLVDSSKFSRRGFGKICELSQVDLVITDSGINPSMQRQLEVAGVEILVV